MPLARARAIRGGCGRTVRLVCLTLEIKAVAGILKQSQEPAQSWGGGLEMS